MFDADIPDDATLITALTHHADVLARRRPPAERWLVLTGDWGGQVLLTVPWSLVGTDAKPLTLLRELNEIAWSSDHDHDGAGAFIFEPKKRTDERKVDGGMGGGALTNTLWMHEHDFSQAHYVRARELLCITESRVRYNADKSFRS